MKIARLLAALILFLIFPLLSFADISCLKTTYYQFTNNFDRTMIFRKAYDGNDIKSFQSLLPSKRTETVSVCAFTVKEPSMVISSMFSSAEGKVNYRFMFLPMSYDKFSGEPYSNVAFSTSSNNRHIFLCSSKNFLLHQTCNF